MERDSLYLEAVDKKDKMFVGPCETVVHSPESDQKKGHLERLVPAPSSLRETHPCGDNRSYDELVEENEGLRRRVCQLETRWEEHGKVYPMSGATGEEVKQSGFDCDEKPLTCSSIHEATSSLKKTSTQLESELMKTKDENQKLMEKCATLEVHTSCLLVFCSVCMLIYVYFVIVQMNPLAFYGTFRNANVSSPMSYVKIFLVFFHTLNTLSTILDN